jgi:flagellar hook-associated protein 3 FlgL
MRISDSMRLSSATAGQARLSAQLFELSNKATSGQIVDRPSEGPTLYTRLSLLDARKERLEGRKRGADQAQLDLELSESALASASDLLVRARELAVSMADGTVDPATRASAAKEIADLRASLVGLANGRGSRGFLFAGTLTSTTPFSPAGAFAGNDQVMNVEVADGVYVAGNASGARAFTAAGGRDVFADLMAFEAALANDDDAGIAAAIDAMTASHDQVVVARSEVGLSLDRVRTSSEIADASLVAVAGARAREGEVDAVDVLSRLVNAQQAYERSLAVTKQVLSMLAASASM